MDRIVPDPVPLARNAERGRHTDRRLAEAGWLPVRVWEHEDPEKAAQRVAEAVVPPHQ